MRRHRGLIAAALAFVATSAFAAGTKRMESVLYDFPLGIRGPVQEKGPSVHDVEAYGAKCDGVTDDTTALQAAAFAADPGVIVLPPGKTCRLRMEDASLPYGILLSNDSGVYGYGATVKATDDPTVAAAHVRYLFSARYTNAHDITIAGGTYDGNGQNGNTGGSENWHGIRIGDPIRLTIVDTTWQHFRGEGVSVDYATTGGAGIVIRNNRIIETGRLYCDDGADCGGGGVCTSGFCTSGSGSAFVPRQGIAVTGGSVIIVEGNTCSGPMGGYCIDMEGDTAGHTLSNVIVQGNALRGTAQGFINLTTVGVGDCNHFVVANNTDDGAAERGIAVECRNGSVVGNNVSSNTTDVAAIAVGDFSGLAGNPSRSEFVSITGNVANYLASTGTQSSCIDISNAKDVTLEGNYCRGTTQTACYESDGGLSERQRIGVNGCQAHLGVPYLCDDFDPGTAPDERCFLTDTTNGYVAADLPSTTRMDGFGIGSTIFCVDCNANATTGLCEAGSAPGLIARRISTTQWCCAVGGTSCG